MSQSHARPGAVASRGQLCATKAPGQGKSPNSRDLLGKDPEQFIPNFRS